MEHEGGVGLSTHVSMSRIDTLEATKKKKLTEEFQEDKKLQGDKMHQGCIAVIEAGSGS